MQDGNIHNGIDGVVTFMLAAVPAIAARLLLVTEPTADIEELKLLLVPLIGALISSGGMIMLNPSPETRRIVIGRAIFALLFGCATPQLLTLLHPAIAAFSRHPVVLLLGGGLAAMVFFAISKPFTNRLIIRSGAIADEAEKRLEEQIGIKGK